MSKSLKGLALISIMILAVLPLFGRGASEEAAPEAVSGREAPMLAEQVAAGTLPALEDRLPANPRIVEPVERVGRHGGTIRRFYTGVADALSFTSMAYDPIFRRSVFDPSIVEPNLAEDWEWRDDDATLRVFLREGTRWSDGERLTADDFVYWYEAVVRNSDLSPSPPEWMMVEGRLGEVVKIDDYTVDFRFHRPSGLIFDRLAQATFLEPMHYMSQFHADFADPDELQRVVEEAGFEQWSQLYQSMRNRFTNPELPVYQAWKIDVPAGVGQRAVAVRNPYYWKTDPEGNQLPYVDRITLDFISDGQVGNLRAIAGEIDFQNRHITFENYPLLQEAAPREGFRVIEWTNPQTLGITFNLNHPDPVKREILGDVRFRQALSLAMNRGEMNELLYYGAGEARQASPIDGSPFFREDYSRAFTDFDLVRAGELLDEIGMNRRDSSGFRLAPDGSSFSLDLNTPGIRDVDLEAELIADYWNEVGIRTTFRSMERSLYVSRRSAGELDTMFWGLQWAFVNPFLFPTELAPTTPATQWGVQWGRWFESDGAQGEEPPQDVKDLVANIEALALTADPDARLALQQDVVDWHYRNLVVLGTIGNWPQVGVVMDGLINVPDDAIWDTGTLGTPGYTMPEQFFWE